MIKVMLDPGHGAGAKHNRGGVLFNEGDNNFRFSTYLKKAMEATGNYKVDMTRKKISDDPSLASRGKMGKGHDLFLSIHTNAAGPSVSGAEIYDDVNPDYANTKMAKDLSKACANALGIPDRGVRYRVITNRRDDWEVYSKPQRGRSNYYGVLRNSFARRNMLLEICFHTNKNDSRKFLDNYDGVAKAIIGVLNAHYGVGAKKEAPTKYKGLTGDKFIDAIKDGAISAWHSHKILPSLTIAQAILESDWGRSELAQNAYALFGIKAHTDPSHLNTYLKDTWEYLDGKNIQVKASFKAYDSWEESIKDRSSYLTDRVINGKKIYAPVIGEKDYKKACRKIWEAGYATDPNYPSKLIKIIEDNKLYRYDELAFEQNHLSGGEKDMDFAICYWNDGDLSNAQALLNALGARAMLTKTKDATSLPAKEVIQIGGAEIKGADIVLAGDNRILTLQEVNEFALKALRGEI